MSGIGSGEDGAPVSIGTYRVIDSQVLGETRRLLIHLPRGYEGSAITYPVVYHTYGDYISRYYAEAFSTLEQLGNSSRIPQMILVGIDNIDRLDLMLDLSQPRIHVPPGDIGHAGA